jgi:hypothetical protein
VQTYYQDFIASWNNISGASIAAWLFNLPAFVYACTLDVTYQHHYSLVIHVAVRTSVLHFAGLNIAWLLFGGGYLRYQIRMGTCYSLFVTLLSINQIHH